MTKVLGLQPTPAQATKVLLELRPDLPLMIVAGNKNKVYFAEAERLHTLFLQVATACRRRQARVDNRLVLPEDRHDVAGGRASGPAALKVPEKIVNFMTVWLVKNSDAKGWKWRQLKKPYE